MTTKLTKPVEKTIDLGEFLMYANAVIRDQGYMNSQSAKTQGKSSTAELAWDWAIGNKSREIIPAYKSIEDREIAAEVIEWLEFENLSYETNDYLVKLFDLGQAGIVTEKTRGFAASAIQAMKKDKEKAKEKSAESGKSENSLSELEKNFGAPGTKIQRQLIFVSRNTFDSHFGLANKYTFEDTQKNKIVWITSTELEEMRQGNSYWVSGSIKKYSSFKGSHSVEITRAKIQGI